MQLRLSRLIKRLMLAGGFLLVWAAVGAMVAHGQVNPEINYQGKLTDSSGVAVPDGSYHMRFWLITSPTAATTSPSAVWSEERTGGDRVTVTNGLFSVMLGSTSPLTSVDFDQTLYLAVEIGGSGGTPSWDGEMSPRKVLGTVPAAFEARRLSGIASSSFLRSDEPDTLTTSSVSTLLTIDQSGTGDILNILDGGSEVMTVRDGGNVGIGSTSPAATLSVAGDTYLAGDLTATGTLAVEGTGTSTNAGNFELVGDLAADQLFVSGATSTFADGIDLAGGCFSINGTCLDLSGDVASLNDLSDVSATAALGNLLHYDGTQWSDIATSSLNINTDNLVEGTNLFYTDARVATYITGSTTISTLGQEIDISSESNLSVSATGLTLNGDDIELDADRTIPLTASTTDWESFYDLPSTRITDGAGLAWSGNTLDIDIDTLGDGPGLGSGDYLIYEDSNGSINRVAYSNLPGAGGGLTSLNGEADASQNFATSSDTNIRLSITSSGGTHTFSPSWAGVLAAGRGGTGIGSPTDDELLIGTPSGWTQIATSSLGITFSTLVGTLDLASQVTGTLDETYIDDDIARDTELYTDADIDGTESAFTNWDKDVTDDFDGVFSSLTSIPAGLSDGDDTDDDVSGTELDALLFSGNGFLKRTGANTFTTDAEIDFSSETNATAGTGIAFTDDDLTVDLNELTTETSIATTDFIAMVDDTDDGSGKITYANFVDGDWTGTFDGEEGSYYLDASNLTIETSDDWTGTIDGNNFAGGAVASGDLLYGSGAGAISELSIGGNGEVLTVSGGLPSWSATSSLGLGDGTFLGLSDTPSAYTAGSILFTSGSGVASDTDQFFWDNTNNRLGIASSSPVSRLSIMGSSGVSSENLITLHSDEVWPGYLVSGGTAGTGVDGLRLRNDAGNGFNVGVGGSSFGSRANSFFIFNKGEGFAMDIDGNKDTTFYGDLLASTDVSSTTDPRIFGFTDLSSNEAMRFQFGDAANAIQNSLGGAVELYSYHSLRLMGDRNTGPSSPPSFSTESDIGVHVINTTVSSPALVVSGASGQTGDLFQIRDNASTELLTVDAAGNVGVGSSSPYATLGVVGSDGQLSPLLDIASSTNESFVRVTSDGLLGIGTTSPRALLSMSDDATAADSRIGIEQFFTITPSGGGSQYVNSLNLTNSPSGSSNTLVGDIIKVTDDTSLANTVRALEVQASLGGNTQGENTAISGFGRTFGVRAVTEGDAGDTFVPAGLFAQSKGSTQGNAIRAYSSDLTSGELVYLFQESSTFGGTGLRMNLGVSGGFTGDFLDLQLGGVSKFTVSDQGTTTIGDGSNQAGLQIGYGGLCVDNDGSCTASTTGRISYIDSYVGNSDLAERYFSDDDLSPGEIVSTDRGLAVERASQAADSTVLGVVSTKPGIMLGADDMPEAQGAYPIGLVGRVPVLVSTENGDIEPGDRVTLSSLDGVGMRADSGGEIVGVALEAFNARSDFESPLTRTMIEDGSPRPELDPSRVAWESNDARLDGGVSLSEEETDETVGRETVSVPRSSTIQPDTSGPGRAVTRRTPAGETVRVGKVMVFINLGYFKTPEEDDAGFLATLTAALETIGIGIRDGVVEAREFVAGVITAETVETEGIQMRDQETGETYCVIVSGGELVHLPGLCGEANDPAPADTTGTTPTNDHSDATDTQGTANTSSDQSNVDTSNGTDGGVNTENEGETTLGAGAEDTDGADAGDTAGGEETETTASTDGVDSGTADQNTSDPTITETTIDDTTDSPGEVSEDPSSETGSTGTPDTTTGEATDGQPAETLSDPPGSTQETPIRETEPDPEPTETNDTPEQEAADAKADPAPEEEPSIISSETTE